MQYTIKQFRHDMERGLGRAPLALDKALAEGNSIEKYRSTVLYGCRHNIVLDTQNEGGRSEYIYHLLCRFKNPSYFKEPILEDFLRYRLEDNWKFQHLCDLIFYFAKNGSLFARKSLYQKYDQMLDILKHRSRMISGHTFPMRENYEHLCTCLIDLDGMKAFNHIAEDMGQLFQKEKLYDALDFEWFWQHSKAVLKKRQLLAALKFCPNENTTRFLSAIQKGIATQTQWHVENKIKNDFKIEDVLIAAQDPQLQNRRMLRLFARKASPMELQRLAQLALDETNGEKKAFLLSPFTWLKIPFPLDCTPILAYANSPEDSLQKVALEVLCTIRDDRVYAFAKKLITQKKNIPEAISMLAVNYRPADKELLLKTVRSLPVSYSGEGDWHGTFRQLHDLYGRKDGTPLPKELLLYMYENTLCSCCRYVDVTEMGRRRLLTRGLLTECLQDSNPDIRKYARKKVDKYFDKNQI